jgi:cyclase
MKLKKRIIPILQIHNGDLVKTKNYEINRYIGDPINAVKIFNEKEVHELVIIDIGASRKEYPIQFETLKKISSEAFFPLAYGGGVNVMIDAEKLISSGFEKMIINTAIFENAGFIKDLVKNFGSQSIVASIDIKRNVFGTDQVVIKSGSQKTKFNINDCINYVQDLGIGEIVINYINIDGHMKGYNKQLIQDISAKCNVPVIGSCGASSYDDIYDLLKDENVYGAAAGSVFIFFGKRNAVLINYPSKQE